MNKHGGDNSIWNFLMAKVAKNNVYLQMYEPNKYANRPKIDLSINI